ncbi:MAG: IS200/IS605 family transposase [Elusimicrobiota bacterium]
MSGSFLYIGIHFIFSTKNRVNIITSEIKDRLYSYIGGIIKSIKGIPIAINGMPDHIHVFCIVSREMTIADFMRIVKSNSSKWLNETFPVKPKFQWQDGYGSFSVTKSSENKIIEYVKNQEEHHKQKSFQDEFIEYLRLMKIDYDERYIWQ